MIGFKTLHKQNQVSSIFFVFLGLKIVKIRMNVSKAIYNCTPNITIKQKEKEREKHGTENN